MIKAQSHAPRAKTMPHITTLGSVVHGSAGCRAKRKRYFADRELDNGMIITNPICVRLSLT